MSRSTGNESADSCCLSPSEGGHGLADEERVNGVLIAGTVYRNSCESADSWPPRWSGGSQQPLCCLGSIGASATPCGSSPVASLAFLVLYRIATATTKAPGLSLTATWCQNPHSEKYKVRLHQAGPESFKLSDTHTKSHKLICPGHGAPQSMAYSFTSVGKLSVYVRGGSLIIWKI